MILPYDKLSSGSRHDQSRDNRADTGRDVDLGECICEGFICFQKDRHFNHTSKNEDIGGVPILGETSTSASVSVKALFVFRKIGTSTIPARTKT